MEDKKKLLDEITRIRKSAGSIATYVAITFWLMTIGGCMSIIGMTKLG